MDPKQTQLSGSSAGPAATGGHDSRSSEEIARSIAMRRAEMSAIADVLEERLAPRQIADEVSHAVKKQLQGRTRRAASSVASSVRKDPFPWMLMGLGAAWLIKERRERSQATRFGAAKRGVGDSGALLGVSSYGSMGHAGTAYDPVEHLATTHPMESPVAPVPGLSDSRLGGARDVAGVREVGGDVAYEEHGGVAEKAHEMREKVGDKAHEVSQAVGDKAHEVREKVAEKTSLAKERVAEAAHEVRERVSSTMSRAGHGAQLARQRAAEKARAAGHELSRQYDSTPLLLGLAALIGGVALGAALPATRKEEEVLGPARDRLLERARETGRDVAGKVSRVAEAAVHSAVDQVERQGSEANLGRMASMAAQAASQAAREEAARQGLAPTQGERRTDGLARPANETPRPSSQPLADGRPGMDAPRGPGNGPTGGSRTAMGPAGQPMRSGASDGPSGPIRPQSGGGPLVGGAGSRNLGAGGGSAMGPGSLPGGSGGGPLSSSGQARAIAPGSGGGGPLVDPSAGIPPGRAGAAGSPGSAGGPVERPRGLRSGDEDGRFDPERDPRES